MKLLWMVIIYLFIISISKKGIMVDLTLEKLIHILED